MWTSERIKQLRLTHHLSQTELADLLGCRQQTVSEWETGIYLPGNAYSRLLENLALTPKPATSDSPAQEPMGHFGYRDFDLAFD